MVVRKLDLILFKGTVLSVIVLSVIKCSWVKVILICGLLRKEKYIFVPFKNLFLKYLIWLRKKNNLYYLNFFLLSALFDSLLPQMYSQLYFLHILHIYAYVLHLYCKYTCIFVYILQVYFFAYITMVHSFGNECFSTNWAFTCCL